MTEQGNPPTPIERAERLAAELREDATRRDAEDQFPVGWFRRRVVPELGAALVPTAWGGADASYPDTCAIIQRLARGDPSVALVLSMHTHTVAAALHGARRQDPGAQAVLRRVGQEGVYLATSGGRDWLESNGRLTEVRGGFRLTATKAFVSGIRAADRLVTSAPLATGDPEEVLHFAISTDAPGVELGGDWQAHGMRATGSETVRLNDVFVPEEAIRLRRPRHGFPNAWNVVLTAALPLIHAAYLGLYEAAVERSTRFAAAASKDRLTQDAVGEAWTRLHLARAAHRRMVDLTEGLDFEPALDRTSEMLALAASLTETVAAGLDPVMEAAGGRGFFRRAEIERAVRDARAQRYHPLPARAQRGFTGRLALGEPVVSPNG